MRLGLGMTEPFTIHYGLWDGSSVILCGYALVFTLLCIKRKEYPRAFMLFVPTSAILLTILYCPYVSTYLTSLMPSGFSEQIQVLRRFRWLFMTLPLLSFGLMFIISRMEVKLQKALLAIIACMFLFISIYGSDWTNKGLKSGFWDKGNSMSHMYKIPNISLAMGDTIMEENADFFAENKRNFVTVLAGKDGSGGIRNDGKDSAYFIRCMREYISPVQYTEIDITKKDYDTDIKGNEKYALCPDDKEFIDAFTKLGYDIKWEMDGYCFMIKGALR